MTEECFFFDEETSGHKLFGCLHLPDGEAARTGVVVASPVGRERLRFYRELVYTSRALADRGVAVLRFDYRGEGESEGTFQQSTLASRAVDLVSAAKTLRQRSGCGEVCPLGIREGALVTLLALERIAPQRVIFCEPICNPKAHARNLLRTHLLLQKQYYGKTSMTSQEARRVVQQGGSISIYGFELTAPLLEELERLDPQPLLRAFPGDSALIYIAPKQVPPKRDLTKWRDLLESNGGRCEARCTVHNFSWTTKKLWSARLEALENELLGWLAATAPPEPAEAQG